MRVIVILATALCAALVSSHPLPERERLQNEALNRLMMIEADNETTLRNKRTIGILRELFPEASQMVEQKVNAIVAEIIRAVGPTLLSSALGNNRPAGSGSASSDGSTATAASPFADDEDDDDFKSTSANGSKVSISLPTFPPDADEETGAPTSPSSTETTGFTMTDSDQDSTTEASNTVA